MDKPFKTISEQIELLQSRGISTDGRTGYILEREGYYSVINGYKDIFLTDPNLDIYKQGTTFEDIYQLFKFDRFLRTIMFRYFSMAEATLKTVCAYVFMGEHADQAEPYLDKTNYRQEKHYRDQIDRLIKEFKTALGHNPYKKPKRKLYMEHYLTKHDSVPFWVLARYLTLGQVFKFYCFQPEHIRNKIAHSFSTLYASVHKESIKISQRKLRLIFDHIKDFRNICAHDERLYCARVSPSLDVSFADVLNDLELVLPKSEYIQLSREIINALIDLSKNTKDSEVLDAVLKKMDFESIDSAFSIRE